MGVDLNVGAAARTNRVPFARPYAGFRGSGSGAFSM